MIIFTLVFGTVVSILLGEGLLHWSAYQCLTVFFLLGSTFALYRIEAILLKTHLVLTELKRIERKRG